MDVSVDGCWPCDDLATCPGIGRDRLQHPCRIGNDRKWMDSITSQLPSSNCCIPSLKEEDKEEEENELAAVNNSSC